MTEQKIGIQSTSRVKKMSEATEPRDVDGPANPLYEPISKRIHEALRELHQFWSIFIPKKFSLKYGVEAYRLAGKCQNLINHDRCLNNQPYTPWMP